MQNNTITIDKAKYRLLLERLFNFNNSGKKVPLYLAVGAKIERIGADMLYGSPKSHEVRNMFADISLLAEYVELVDDPISEETPEIDCN